MQLLGTVGVYSRRASLHSVREPACVSSGSIDTAVPAVSARLRSVSVSSFPLRRRASTTVTTSGTSSSSSSSLISGMPLSSLSRLKPLFSPSRSKLRSPAEFALLSLDEQRDVHQHEDGQITDVTRALVTVSVMGYVFLTGSCALELFSGRRGVGPALLQLLFCLLLPCIGVPAARNRHACLLYTFGTLNGVLCVLLCGNFTAQFLLARRVHIRRCPAPAHLTPDQLVYVVTVCLVVLFFATACYILCTLLAFTLAARIKAFSKLLVPAPPHMTDMRADDDHGATQPRRQEDDDQEEEDFERQETSSLQDLHDKDDTTLSDVDEASEQPNDDHRNRTFGFPHVSVIPPPSSSSSGGGVPHPSAVGRALFAATRDAATPPPSSQASLNATRATSSGQRLVTSQSAISSRKPLSAVALAGSAGQYNSSSRPPPTRYFRISDADTEAVGGAGGVSDDDL